MSISFWMRSGAALMFLAVALGAFGAHGLKNKLAPDMLAVFETGVRYQVYHALALFLVAWFSSTHPSTKVDFAGISFMVGIVLFSGSLYALSITGVRKLGIITPIGGLSFLLGWLFLLLAPMS